jgi:uncharacterized lipoprotein YajG
MCPMAMKLVFVLLCSVVLCGCNASKQAASTPAPTPLPTPTAVTATVATGAGPYRVAVNAITNLIYVANYASNNVMVLCRSSQEPWWSHGECPHGEGTTTAC